MNNAVRVLAIVNPSADRNRGSQAWSSIRSRLPDDTTIYFSADAEDAEDRARIGAVEGFDVVLAAGGDGTIHQVVNGLMSSNRKNVTLGVAAIGSANDFAAGADLTGESGRASPPWKSAFTIDIGMIESSDQRRFFCNAIGIGLPAAVAMRGHRIKRLPGRWAYSAALLRSTLSDVHWPLITWQVDDKTAWTEPTLSLTAALGPRQGSFVLAPDAKFADGEFDVLHVGKLGRLGLLRYFPRLISGRIPTNDSAIRATRCHSIKISDSSEPLTVHLDGEMFVTPADDCRYLRVTLIPKRLQVLLM